MPNDYFRFKEFTIRQDRCAMKVCTDSCVLGAYAASEILRMDLRPESILDIGGGTGLLSLMLAQKTSANIDAVEIHKPCRQQMKENFANAPWSRRLCAIHADIITWKPSKRYDLVISNPPFFENDLKSANEGKTLAMHDSGMLLSDLITVMRSSLTDKGSFCIMIPASRKNYFEEELAGNHACVTSMLALRHREGKTPFRLIYSGIFFVTGSAETHSEELVIEDHSGYTRAFKSLLKDYYLNL